MSFDVVVAADLEWGIGKANALPWPKLSGDLQHFKRITSDAPEGTRNAVIMGRKTWESAEVKQRPLPRRLNIIVSRTGIPPVPGVVCAASLDAALDAAQGAHATFVVGGAALLGEALVHPALRHVYLTRIEGRFGCDVFLPDLDRDFVHDPWGGEQVLEDSGVRYRIMRLRRRPGT